MPNQELFIDPKIKAKVTAAREQSGYKPRRLLPNDEIVNKYARVEKTGDRIGEIAEELGKMVFGQDKACEALSRHLAIAEAGWADPKRPLCSVMFLGPTGTGKTEMARSLSNYLFGDPKSDRLKIVRMQEYMTQDKIGKLTGVAPGFVGSDEEPEIPHSWLHEEEDVVDPETGKVTKKMKQSIIVFDEFEKAHPDIRKALLSVLDEGEMNARVGDNGDNDQSNGTKPLNFRNSFIILTSNIGSDKMKPSNTATEIESIGREAVKKKFKDMPEFLGRLTDTVAFMHLGTREYKNIFDKLLNQRIKELQEANPDTSPNSFTVSEELRQYFIANVNPELGGRSLRNSMDHELFSEAAQSVAGMTGDIHAVLEDGKVYFHTDNPDRKAAKQPAKQKEDPTPTESGAVEIFNAEKQQPQEKTNPLIERAKEVLGKDFIGPEDLKKIETFINEKKVFKDPSGNVLEFSFGLDNLPEFPFTEKDIEFAKANNEMLVLRPNYVTIAGNKKPFTARALMNLFSFDPYGSQPSLIPSSEKTWEQEKWANTTGVNTHEWAFVKKDLLKQSTDKTWNEQQSLLREYDNQIRTRGGNDITKNISRRTPQEALWDAISYYWKNRECLLENELDWLDTRTDKGNLLLFIGEFSNEGIAFSAAPEDGSAPNLGVCPQRKGNK